MNEQLHEINGKKFLIKSDPTMTAIEEYRVGDQVMVLKKMYGDEYKTFPGVIIGFFEFNALPTIHIAYLNIEYTSAKVEFIAYNTKVKEIEFCRYVGDDLPYGKDRVLTMLASEIQKKEEELREAKHKRDYFIECFGHYFPASADATAAGGLK